MQHSEFEWELFDFNPRSKLKVYPSNYNNKICAMRKNKTALNEDT